VVSTKVKTAVNELGAEEKTEMEGKVRGRGEESEGRGGESQGVGGGKCGGRWGK
jgi:hypothetical protein